VTEAPIAPVDNAGAENTPRRGRPRPSVTLERDEQVFGELTSGGRTRTQLSEVIDATPGQIYLSLYRLRKTDRVEKVRENGKHVWRPIAGVQSNAVAA
jgi:hypothetical protein